MTIYTPFEGETLEEFKAHRIDKTDFLLCHNCGWTAENEQHDTYVSTVKCKCNARRGIWFLGENYVLKEREIIEYGHNFYLGPEVAIARFLTENSTIPVTNYVQYWKDNTSHFFFMERVPGETLAAAWRKLTLEQQKDIAREVVEYLIQLRKFTSEKIEAPDGSPIRDKLLNTDLRVEFVTDDAEKWWATVEPHLENKWDGQQESGQWKESLKSKYPVKGPYVLTHGDLNAVNILVKDGHVTGIIDWEHGGYLPEWWESVRFRGIELGAWGYLLELEMSKQIGTFKAEKNFCMEFSTGFYDQREWVYHAEQRYFDRSFYSKCTNYTRYLEEVEAGFDRTMKLRERRHKEQAKEEATLEAFKALSLKEREDLLGIKNS